jgi:hypothetical protein
MSSYSFIHSHEEWMTFVLLMMMLTYFGMAHVRKIGKKKRKDEDDDRRWQFFFFSFILRKLLADEMIICLLSCIVTVSLLMMNGNTERNERIKKKECDARAGARTLDIVVKSHTLYRLSYPGHSTTRTKLCNLFDLFSSLLLNMNQNLILIFIISLMNSLLVC